MLRQRRQAKAVRDRMLRERRARPPEPPGPAEQPEQPPEPEPESERLPAES